MPSDKIMSLYRAGKLHAGPAGVIVTKKSQAKAILISYLKKEGKIQ